MCLQTLYAPDALQVTQSLTQPLLTLSPMLELVQGGWAI